MTLGLLIFACLLAGSALWLTHFGHTFTRIDAGGPELRALLMGSGSNTVVFESGAGSPLETWVCIQPAVSRFARTMAYDRAGHGLSQAGSTPRDGRQIATELHLALRNAHLPPPYILVGHSLGGPFIRIFAGMYPSEVSGLVLVDATQEELIAWNKARENKPPSVKEPRSTDEVDCAPLTFQEAKDYPVPRDLPVALISGLGPRHHPSFLTPKQKQEILEDQKIFGPMKLKFHKEWVSQFPNGRFIETQESGHGVPFEEPELVVRTIREMLEASNRFSAGR